MKFRYLITLSLLFFGMYSFAQSWNYKTPITVSTDGVQRTDYQIKVTLNTQALIAAGKMQSDGSDMRFGDACQTTFYSHWVESAMNTDTTLIWVKVPSIPAANDTTIFLYYGNPLATTADNFNTTFPNALVTGGNNVTLTGSLTHDWVQIDAGDTLFITAGSPLNISGTRKAIINGVVWGKGRGYQSAALNTNGNGPGAGTTSAGTNSGAGGGSYAGTGGTGGYDSGDTPGVGGATYGTNSGTDIDMGSSGGSGNTDGGAGGGCFSLDAETIAFTGIINVDGNDAITASSTSRGGGGGSGGGVKMSAYQFTGSGTISANGGNGAVGTSSANDSGGGGGGGRVKQFAGSFSPTYLASAMGGTGGPYGTAAAATNGTYGVTGLDVAPIVAFPAGIIGTETTPPQANLLTSGLMCEGTPVVVSLDETFASYDWSDGSLADTTVVYMDETIIVTVTDSYGCTYADTLVIDLNPMPIPMVSINPAEACQNDTVTFTCINSFASYDWVNMSNTTNTLQITTSGNYTLNVVDNNGCPGSTIVVPTFNSLPTPVITANPPQACEGEQITLNTQSDFASYNWSTGSTSVTAVGQNAGTYTVDVVDTNGCTAQATFVYTPFPTPVVTITQVDFTLEATAGFATYQWYLDNTMFVGETGQTYNLPTDIGGNFIVVVTDSNGCTGTDTLYVDGGSVHELPTWLDAAYPNPTSGLLTLALNSTTNNSAVIRIIDLTGKLVLVQEITVQAGKSQYVTDLSSLEDGSYFVRIELAGKQHTLPIVKQ